MNIRVMFVCAFLPLASLTCAAAWAEPVELPPIHAGSILDQDPFDGLGDAVDESGGAAIGLNSPLLDSRAIAEFDLATLGHRRIQSATLQLTPLGRAILPGTSRVPIQLYAFPADTTIQLRDFNQGIFVDVFEGLTPLNEPVSIDVTNAVRFARLLRQQYLGFSLRTSSQGSSITYGSPAIGSAPKLVIALE